MHHSKFYDICLLFRSFGCCPRYAIWPVRVGLFVLLNAIQETKCKLLALQAWVARYILRGNQDALPKMDLYNRWWHFWCIIVSTPEYIISSHALSALTDSTTPVRTFHTITSSAVV